jgi:hypothetical protein
VEDVEDMEELAGGRPGRLVGGPVVQDLVAPSAVLAENTHDWLSKMAVQRSSDYNWLLFRA